MPIQAFDSLQQNQSNNLQSNAEIMRCVYYTTIQFE